MLVIIEGPDNAGKTTLARRLASKLRGVYINSRLRPESMEELIDYTAALTNISMGRYVILDRVHHISEPIYGPIIRNTNIFNRDDCIQLHKEISSHPFNAITIYCRPPQHIIEGSYDQKQMKGVIENMPQLIIGYDRMMADLEVTYFTHDYTYPSSFDDLFHYVSKENP